MPPGICGVASQQYRRTLLMRFEIDRGACPCDAKSPVSRPGGCADGATGGMAEGRPTTPAHLPRPTKFSAHLSQAQQYSAGTSARHSKVQRAPPTGTTKFSAYQSPARQYSARTHLRHNSIQRVPSTGTTIFSACHPPAQQDSLLSWLWP